MPFDGSGYEGRVQALDKMDRVIDLLSDPRHWCKKRLRTPDGRYCLLGAIRAEGLVNELVAPLLLAIGWALILSPRPADEGLREDGCS